ARAFLSQLPPSHLPQSSATHTLPLHDALPICCSVVAHDHSRDWAHRRGRPERQPHTEREFRHHCRYDCRGESHSPRRRHHVRHRSEEHTSELQSRENLVCRLLLEKKKESNIITDTLLVDFDSVIYFQVTDATAAMYENANYITGVAQLNVTTYRNRVATTALYQPY